MQEAHRRFQASRKDENQRISRAKRQKCGGEKGDPRGREGERNETEIGKRAGRDDDGGSLTEGEKTFINLLRDSIYFSLFLLGYYKV